MKSVILFLLLSPAFFGTTDDRPAAQAFVNGKVSAAEFLPIEDKAAEFELKDQYNKSFALKFPREKAIVLVFGDREGSQQIESWVRPLVEKYQTDIDIQGVAELSAVPGLAQGIVRRIMKNQVKYSVMLDWKGDVSKSYGYQKGKANLFVIDKNGKIIAKATGAATKGELENIFRDINGIL